MSASHLHALLLIPDPYSGLSVLTKHQTQVEGILGCKDELLSKQRTNLDYRMLFIVQANSVGVAFDGVDQDHQFLGGPHLPWTQGMKFHAEQGIAYVVDILLFPGVHIRDQETK